MDKLKVLVVLLVAALVIYNIYTGLTVQKIVIPGLFEIYFGPSKTTTSEPPPSSGATGCGGVEVGGSCWYLGTENVSCDYVCSSHGGYGEGTRTYAGSDGSAGNCQNVLGRLGISYSAFYNTTQGGLGCFIIQNTSGNYFGYWDQQPTSASATYGTPGRRRVCACQK